MIKHDIARQYLDELLGENSELKTAYFNDHPMHDEAVDVISSLYWFAYGHPKGPDGNPRPFHALKPSEQEQTKAGLIALYPERAELNRRQGHELDWDGIVGNEGTRRATANRQKYLESTDPQYSRALTDRDHPRHSDVLAHRDAYHEWMHGNGGATGLPPSWPATGFVRQPQVAGTSVEGKRPDPYGLPSSNQPKIGDNPSPSFDIDSLARIFGANVGALLGLDPPATNRMGALAQPGDDAPVLPNENDVRNPEFIHKAQFGGTFRGQLPSGGMPLPRFSPNSSRGEIQPKLSVPPAQPPLPKSWRIAPGMAPIIVEGPNAGINSGKEDDPYPYPEDDRRQLGGESRGQPFRPDYSPFPEDDDQGRGGNFTLPPIVIPDLPSNIAPVDAPYAPKRYEEIIPAIGAALFAPLLAAPNPWGRPGKPDTVDGNKMVAEECEDIVNEYYPSASLHAVFEKYYGPTGPDDKVLKGVRKGASYVDIAMAIRLNGEIVGGLNWSTADTNKNGEMTPREIDVWNRMIRNMRSAANQIAEWSEKFDRRKMTKEEYRQIVRAKCFEKIREALGEPQIDPDTSKPRKPKLRGDKSTEPQPRGGGNHSEMLME